MRADHDQVRIPVRNGGAAIARGEILCFVDADMQIHPETFHVIERTLETGRVIAGATGVRLDVEPMLKRVMEHFGRIAG